MFTLLSARIKIALFIAMLSFISQNARALAWEVTLRGHNGILSSPETEDWSLPVTNREDPYFDDEEEEGRVMLSIRRDPSDDLNSIVVFDEDEGDVWNDEHPDDELIEGIHYPVVSERASCGSWGEDDIEDAMDRLDAFL